MAFDIHGCMMFARRPTDGDEDEGDDFQHTNHGLYRDIPLYLKNSISLETCVPD